MQVNAEGAVGGVRSATEGVVKAQLALDAAVFAARGAGASWAQIGQAAGMSRQSAHERWGRTPRRDCQQPDCPCVKHDPGPRVCDCGHGPGRGHRTRRSALQGVEVARHAPR